jgi:hypothetical protein
MKTDELRREYDFSSGVRGKHFRSYRKGHRVRIHRADGLQTVRYFTQRDGAVMLDPDVRAFFRSERAVNRALRQLIAHP